MQYWYSLLVHQTDYSKEKKQNNQTCPLSKQTEKTPARKLIIYGIMADIESSIFLVRSFLGHFGSLCRQADGL